MRTQEKKRRLAAIMFTDIVGAFSQHTLRPYSIRTMEHKRIHRPGSKVGAKG